MQTRNATIIMLLSTLALPGLAQTPLGKLFIDMHSSDPATAKAARHNGRGPLLLVDEMPTIEKDTNTLCKALSDPDAYIRLQSASILTTIVIASPSHNQVVVSCFPGLLSNATDPDDMLRNDSLFALAMNPAGPPPQAHETFVHALASTNLRTAEVGAAGLLKENGGHRQENHRIVEQALIAAPDSKHALNLLYAIGGSGVQSESLFQASQRFISDPDAEIQDAAIEAVAATGTDKAKVVTVMQNLAGSASASVQSKQHAQAVISRMQAAQ